MILFGGFVEALGPRPHASRFATTSRAFAISSGAFGLRLDRHGLEQLLDDAADRRRRRRRSTAAIGLLTAYLLVRQKFAGKRAFEFGTMLSFAIPGTVIGVAYIIAFNVPPIELTGTGMILDHRLRLPQHAGRRARPASPPWRSSTRASTRPR